MPEQTFSAELLWLAMDRKRRSERITWRHVARDVGMSPGTFSRMGLDGKPPSVDGLVRMLAWLGESDLKPYLRVEANDGR